MSNPGSPTPRGRGRGRWKEMSSNERVANWVNQREAKRLNKERWANPVPGANSSAGDGGDFQMSTKQEGVELESSLDRSKAKRQNVQLYVPPSLRARKESGTNKDASDFNLDSSAGKGPESDDRTQNGGIVNSFAVRENVVSCETEEQWQTCRETSRSKGRGRGRKKPEVEIYVPRALRAAKHESKCVPGAQDLDGHRSLCVEEIQQKSQFADCDISVSTNVLPSQSFTQSPEFSDECISGRLHDQVPDNEIQHYSSGELIHHYEVGGCQPSFCHDSVTKKVKYESTSSSLHQYKADAPPVSSTSAEVSTKQAYTESPEDSLTFEFYDPAVLAFLPSSCSVQKSSDINMSYSMDNSRQAQSAPQISASSQQNVTVLCGQSISSDAHSQTQHMNNEYQSQISIEKDTEHSMSSVSEDTHKDSEEGRVSPTDACVNQSIESFSSEQMNTNDLLDSQNNKESSESLRNSVVDDCHKPIMAVDDAAAIRCEAHIEIVEDVLGVSGNVDRLDVDFIESMPTATHSAQRVNPCESMSQKDINSSVQQTMQTAVDQLEDSQAYNSEENENGKTVACVASNNLADDGNDSWDALFDDNGDCLDDSTMTELTEYVGKVEIDKPKINYLNYEPKETEMDYEAFSHILEIYDFPPELATCDLITAFRDFSSRGFDVKWVDDTHALAIFSSNIAAKEALRMMHPLLKVRPLSEASKKGQSKARHCQEFLQPYKARPETTSIAARRLVAGALGMMPQVSKEVRELERKKLKEAKERRRQERQQKIDIWDGSFRKCAVDDENTES